MFLFKISIKIFYESLKDLIIKQKELQLILLLLLLGEDLQFLRILNINQQML